MSNSEKHKSEEANSLDASLENDDKEAIEAIVELYEVDEETAREMWNRFKNEVRSAARDR